MRKILATIALMAIAFAASAAAKNYQLSSPDGRLKVDVTTGNDIRYSVTYDGETLINPSPISVTFMDGTVFGGAAVPRRAKVTSADNTIKTIIYRRAVVRDNYNMLTLNFKGFDLLFRAYDEGIAWRFVPVAGKKSPDLLYVKEEQATFGFASDWTAYADHSGASTENYERQFDSSLEGWYDVAPVTKLDPRKLFFCPLLVKTDSGVNICITEADQLDYPGMYLAPDGTGFRGVMPAYPATEEQDGHANIQMLVRSREPYIAKIAPNEAMPWRVVMVEENDTKMLDNDLVYCLATPSEDIDWSWVRPGKVAWDWWNAWGLKNVPFKAGVNNDTYKYYIDFASAHGIEYVILDEGWSVPRKADLRLVVPEIDLQELVDYARPKNVKLILWAGYVPFSKDIEGNCKRFSEMGIAGFKVDFLNRDDQEMLAFMTKASKICAKYHMLLDFHGAPKPTGNVRTFPNVLNHEGVSGLENAKWEKPDRDMVTHDLILPYTRLAAGPMDYTQGAMRNASRANYYPCYTEPMSQGTRSHQIAEYMVFESPLNMLCDSPSNYMAEPECTEFISAIPTVWKETVALDGKVGEYAVKAHEAADGSWYLGALGGWTPRDMTLDLSFLGEGDWSYVAFQDGPNSDNIASDYQKVTGTLAPGERTMDIHLASGGGFAIHFVRK